MARKLTIKQGKFVQKLIDTGNGTEAATQVYNVKNRNTAHTIASENLRKPTIQQAIRQALETEGLTLKSSIKNLKEAVVSGLGKKATNSDTLRGLDMLFKLQGAYNQPVVEETYRMRLEGMSNKELEAEIERIQKETQAILQDAES